MTKTTRKELTGFLIEKHKINKKDALSYIDTVFSFLGAKLKEGEHRVDIRPLILKSVMRKERKGRNPRTGEPVNIPAKLGYTLKVL